MKRVQGLGMLAARTSHEMREEPRVPGDEAAMMLHKLHQTMLLGLCYPPPGRPFWRRSGGTDDAISRFLGFTWHQTDKE